MADKNRFVLKINFLFFTENVTFYFGEILNDMSSSTFCKNKTITNFHVKIQPTDC